VSGKPFASHTLKESYHQVWQLDMRKTKNLVIANVTGLLVLVIGSPLVYLLVRWLRPGIRLSYTIVIGAMDVSIPALLLAMILMLVFHEVLHGLCFWIFTRSVPKFALKIYYAYAAAPGWYLAKWPYFITALAPFAVITLLGLVGMIFGPPAAIFPLMLVTLLNASGAAGDLWVVIALLRRSASVLVEDSGDRVTFYEPMPAEAFLDGASQS